MVALIIMLLALLAMLAVVPFAFESVQTNALQVQAVAIGQQFLDDERNAKLHAIPVPTATTVPIYAGESFVNNGMADNGYGNFSVTPDGCATVLLTGNNVKTYRCSVGVSWTQGSAARSVTVQSLVTE